MIFIIRLLILVCALRGNTLFCQDKKLVYNGNCLSSSAISGMFNHFRVAPVFATGKLTISHNEEGGGRNFQHVCQRGFGVRLRL